MQNEIKRTQDLKKDNIMCLHISFCILDVHGQNLKWQEIKILKSYHSSCTYEWNSFVFKKPSQVQSRSSDSKFSDYFAGDHFSNFNLLFHQISDIKYALRRFSDSFCEDQICI